MAVASGKNDSGFDNDWQNGKSLTECNLQMLTSEESCDVSFRIGKDEEIVRAHRYVLISRSCVFHAMLCDPLAERDDIKIPDVEGDSFRELLKFLYTESCTLTKENVTEVLYLSKTYAVRNLHRTCLEYLEQSLSAETACVVLEQAHVFDEELLFDKALMVILKTTEKSFSFKELSHACLKRAISSENIDMNPELMLNAVLSWAEEECRCQGREVTAANLRSAIGETLYAIPFQKMDQIHYVDIVVPKSILTNEENIAVMSCMLCPEKDPHPFKRPATGRTFPKSKIPDELTDILLYDELITKIPDSASISSDEMEFRFNRKVLLCGVYVIRCFTEESEWTTYRVKVNNASSHCTLENNVYSVTASSGDMDDRTATIFLNKPVAIVGDIAHYVYVEATMKVNQKYYGLGMKNSVTVEGHTFTRIPKFSFFNTNLICGLIFKFDDSAKTLENARPSHSSGFSFSST